MTSYMITENPVVDLWGCFKFRSGDHVQILRDGCADIWRQKTHNMVKSPMDVIRALPDMNA